jgi:hypothetical protein
MESMGRLWWYPFGITAGRAARTVRGGIRPRKQGAAAFSPSVRKELRVREGDNRAAVHLFAEPESVDRLGFAFGAIQECDYLPGSSAGLT